MKRSYSRGLWLLLAAFVIAVGFDRTVLLYGTAEADSHSGKNHPEESSAADADALTKGGFGGGSGGGNDGGPPLNIRDSAIQGYLAVDNCDQGSVVCRSAGAFSWLNAYAHLDQGGELHLEQTDAKGGFKLKVGPPLRLEEASLRTYITLGAGLLYGSLGDAEPTALVGYRVDEGDDDRGLAEEIDERAKLILDEIASKGGDGKRQPHLAFVYAATDATDGDQKHIALPVKWTAQMENAYSELLSQNAGFGGENGSDGDSAVILGLSEELLRQTAVRYGDNGRMACGAGVERCVYRLKYIAATDAETPTLSRLKHRTKFVTIANAWRLAD